MALKKILLIDDEPDIREVASMALEVIGSFEVLTAGGGVEGIAVAQRTAPDVILLDVMMPELDGPSTLARLRQFESTCEIPVIFLTAKVQAADQQRYLQLGVKGVIAKPFDPMTLSDQVVEAVNS
jgi:CheY-like chemotaxis protein